jgi:hypothetical protein
MREAWAEGANYDRSQLTFWTADPGFLLGEAILGESLLGATSADVQLNADFTSLTIDSPTTIEDGLFVHREVETCTLTATLPSMVDLRTKRITVKYAGTELYRGTIRQVTWTESVDIGRDYLLGNTATKTYRMNLRATSGEEILATVKTPPRDFTGESIEDRFESWTGYSTYRYPWATDLPVNVDNAGFDDPSGNPQYVRTTDDVRTLLESMRHEAKLRHMSFTYKPWQTHPIKLIPNNNWTVGSSAAEALVFTDADHGAQATDPSDAFLHLGKFVSYSERTIDEDLGLFPNSVLLSMAMHTIPAVGVETDGEFSIGPFRTTEANPQDVGVDLGRGLYGPGALVTGEEWAEAAMLSFRSTLPLRIRTEPFTSQIVMPLQSTQQLQDQVPGMALLEHDGETERVAVVGRQHTITPSRWLVTYETAPHHLLDRESDLDPGCPEFVSSSYDGTNITLSWKTPHLPNDVQLYRRISQFGDIHNVSWNATEVSNVPATGEVQGDLQTVVIPASEFISTIEGTNIWVTYSSNPTPGSGTPTTAFREGQPCLMGAFTSLGPALTPPPPPPPIID